MTLDEARAVLAQIGAGEDTSAQQCLVLCRSAWEKFAAYPMLEPDIPTEVQALAALDTLRAAERDALRGLVRRLAEGLDSLRTCIAAVTQHSPPPMDTPWPCDTCCWRDPFACDAGTDALLLEARQALGEKP